MVPRVGSRWARIRAARQGYFGDAGCLCGNKWQRSELRLSGLVVARGTRDMGLNSSLRLGPFLWTRRRRSALNVREQPEWSDYLLSFCFCRWVYVLYQHRVGISARRRNKKHVRATLPIFAENNSVTIRLFNSACSRIAQGSVRHVRRFSKATACSVSIIGTLRAIPVLLSGSFMPHPRPKPPAGCITATYPGFIEPGLATSIGY
jgi:hypothetical protein